MGLVSVSSTSFCWLTTSCSNTWHFLWHAPNCSCNISHSNITSSSWIYIKFISPYNTSKTCFAMLVFFVGANVLAPLVSHPWPSIVSNGMYDAIWITTSNYSPSMGSSMLNVDWGGFFSQWHWTIWSLIPTNESWV
jgi:hypothetical protein